MLEVEKAAGDLKTRAEQKATRDIEDSLSPDARKRLKADQDRHEEMLKNFRENPLNPVLPAGPALRDFNKKVERRAVELLAKGEVR
jgi:hypothetical protein